MTHLKIYSELISESFETDRKKLSYQFLYRVVDISINKLFARANHFLALPFMISSGI